MSKLVEDKTKKNLKSKLLRIALAGNPNCGKTTLFNRLTGSKQYVGNWPGVTVEKKEGKAKFFNNEINILDLPGIYSLSPYSPEEVVTRNCIMDENPNLIINIVDATNIERNLYLTTQIAELGKPMIIALNMIDLLEKRGDCIDYKLLEKEIGIPVVPISASKGIGIDKLMKFALDYSQKTYIEKVKNTYSKEVNDALLGIEHVLNSTGIETNINQRFNAVKIFEGDSITLRKFKFTKSQENEILFYKNKVQVSKYLDREMIIADQRYKYICDICSKVVKKKFEQGHMTTSDKVDRLVTNKIFAIPLFLCMMMLVFFITFGPIGNFLKDKTEFLIKDVFANIINSSLISIGTSDWARSLVVDGIIEGVGSVISFLPQILILFTLLSILEDSGYMARAAFIMDQLLRKIGLSGRAFVPMLMGFGCTVPAVLGTRTLESEKDKRLTILITPFMSCSAKMPVYALFISAFFLKNQALIIFSIYLLGIIVAVLSALLFKNTLLKGEPAPFVMELPPYRIPTISSLWMHVWERIKDFLTKAGTVLLAATIVIWFLQSFDLSLNMVDNSSDSILAMIGTFVAPAFTFCGFGDWRASVSLVTGLVAKESVVSTMAVLYSSGTNSNLSVMLNDTFTPLSAYAFMVFVLLYTPCIAALSAIRKEMSSFKWTFIAIFYQLFVAFIASSLVYQIGTLVLNVFSGKTINVMDLIIAVLSISIIIYVIWIQVSKANKHENSCSSCSRCLNKCNKENKK